MYSVRVTQEPAEEPVSLEYVQTHLRNYGTHELPTIARIYIPAARRRVEDEINRQLITATLELSLDRFPPGMCPIRLPRAPLQSVSSIVYQASDGSQTTLPSTDYIVDTAAEPGRIIPKANTPWPATKFGVAAATVLVTFVAGYGQPHQVPAGIREAILLLASHHFYYREPIVAGATVTEIPHAIQDLLNQHSYGDEFEIYGG